MMLKTMAPDFSSYITTASFYYDRFSFNSLNFLRKPKNCCIVFFQWLIHQKVGLSMGQQFSLISLWNKIKI